MLGTGLWLILTNPTPNERKGSSIWKITRWINTEVSVYTTCSSFYKMGWILTCVCVCVQYYSEDTVPPSRWLILHQPVPLTEQTAGGSALCCSGLTSMLCLLWFFFSPNLLIVVGFNVALILSIKGLEPVNGRLQLPFQFTVCSNIKSFQWEFCKAL